MTKRIITPEDIASSEALDGVGDAFLRPSAELNKLSRDADGNVTGANAAVDGTLTGTRLSSRDQQRLDDAWATIELYTNYDMSLNGGPAEVTLDVAAIEYQTLRDNANEPHLSTEQCVDAVRAAWSARGSDKDLRVGGRSSSGIRMSSGEQSDTHDPQIIFTFVDTGSYFYETGHRVAMALAYTPTVFASGVDKETGEVYEFPDMWNDQVGFTHIVRFFGTADDALRARQDLVSAVRTLRQLAPDIDVDEPAYGEQLPLDKKFQRGPKIVAG